MESKQVERVREKIAKFLYETHHPRIYGSWEELCQKYKGSAEGVRQQANQILAIPELLIKADDQSLPNREYPFPNNENLKYGYGDCKQDMLKPDKGYVWMKVILDN